jgi:hypothetical protein
MNLFCVSILAMVTSRANNTTSSIEDPSPKWIKFILKDEEIYIYSRLIHLLNITFIKNHIKPNKNYYEVHLPNITIKIFSQLAGILQELALSNYSEYDLKEKLSNNCSIDSVRINKALLLLIQLEHLNKMNEKSIEEEGDFKKAEEVEIYLQELPPNFLEILSAEFNDLSVELSDRGEEEKEEEAGLQYVQNYQEVNNGVNIELQEADNNIEPTVESEEKLEKKEINNQTKRYAICIAIIYFFYKYLVKSEYLVKPLNTIVVFYNNFRNL